MKTTKESRDYWETRLPQRWYTERERYTKYFPYLYREAEFTKHQNKKVLEIGVGIGRDLLQYAVYGSKCYGIDLTSTAIKTTQKLFDGNGYKVELKRADAENIPYPDNYFDVVYSMGVLHHCRDIDRAVAEVGRVLKPKGKAIVWLYGKNWWYYFFCPVYHGILKGEYFKGKNHREVVASHMEMEGGCPIVVHHNKKEVRQLFGGWCVESIRNYRGYGQVLGDFVKPVNRLFCLVMNFLFPYNAWIIKASFSGGKRR